MELRETWQILLRRWWLPVGLAVLAAASSLLVTARTPERWSGSIRLAISVPGEPPSPSVFQYNNYYTWVTSEYVVDDLSEIMKGRRFAEDLAAESGDTLPVDTILSGERTQKTHRVLTFSIDTGSPETAEKLAATAIRVIQNRGGTYLAQLQQRDALVTVVDGPTVTPVRPVSRTALDAAVRGALGFILGIGVILLLEYLDPTIRSTRDLEGLLGLPVMGEIPQEG